MPRTINRLEDDTTDELKRLLVNVPATIPVLLSFLFPASKMPAFTSRRFGVRTQFPTPNGRIDLLLHTEETDIIIENKVGETPRIGQLRKYHDFWITKYHRTPYIFWLVRRRADRLGRNNYLTRQLSRNDFHAHLLRSNERLKSEAVAAFCEYLQQCGVLLGSHESAVIKKRDRGYDYSHAETLLERVASQFSSVEWRVEAPVNEVSHRLFIGRELWRQKFRDEFIRRARLTYQPIGAGRFRIDYGVLFYNRDFDSRANPAFAISEFPRWASICHACGMKISQSSPGKWRGNKALVVEPPFVLKLPTYYFGARFEAKSSASTFSPQDGDLAVKDGVAKMSRLFELIDKF
ncbi:MAG: nuclease superfamily [Verrucomicrobiota bacterium]|jgi:hypothetical protein